MDLYFEENYGRLYEKIEQGRCEIFEHRSDLGMIRHLFIKRLISTTGGAEEYFDLVTPYGYGGPIILECHAENKKELINEFHTAFKKYCQKNNVVCEFIRFHPVLENALDFSGCYELSLRRKTTGTNLRDFENPVEIEYSKSKQKSIKKALNSGVEYKITLKPDSLDNFKNIYHSTMERKNADKIYYFDSEYFSRLLNLLGEHVLLVEVSYKGQVIGMGLNFVYGNMIHIHLSGTLQEFNYLAPSVMLRYALVEWGKARGVELIHEGGGITGSPDDPLYVFKKQFGKNTEFDYYVSYKIWNKSIYERLLHICKDEENMEFQTNTNSKI